MASDEDKGDAALYARLQRIRDVVSERIGRKCQLWSGFGGPTTHLQIRLSDEDCAACAKRLDISARKKFPDALCDVSSDELDEAALQQFIRDCYKKIENRVEEIRIFAQMEAGEGPQDRPSSFPSPSPAHQPHDTHRPRFWCKPAG